MIMNVKFKFKQISYLLHVFKVGSHLLYHTLYTIHICVYTYKQFILLVHGLK